MTPKKYYVAMVTGVLVLSLAIIGGAYGVQKLLQTKSNELVSLKASLASFSSQQAGLIQAKKDIAEYNDLYNIAKSIVPKNKNQAETVRQIVLLAETNSVALGSITFPNSTLGAMTGGSSGSTTGTTPSLSQTPKPIDENKAALSQLTPVSGSPGVYVMQITVSSDATQPATYPQLISFLSALERNRLTAEVTNINIVPAAGSTSRFSFTLTVNTYIKP